MSGGSWATVPPSSNPAGGTKSGYYTAPNEPRRATRSSGPTAATAPAAPSARTPTRTAREHGFRFVGHDRRARARRL
ncbi:hypothetical protein ACRAWD_31640 [Caulobacter segnis]